MLRNSLPHHKTVFNIKPVGDVLAHWPGNSCKGQLVLQTEIWSEVIEWEDIQQKKKHALQLLQALPVFYFSFLVSDMEIVDSFI